MFLRSICHLLWCFSREADDPLRTEYIFVNWSWNRIMSKVLIEQLSKSSLLSPPRIPTLLFRLIVPRRFDGFFLCRSFITTGPLCLVIVYASPFLPTVFRESLASWLCPFLRNFICIFGRLFTIEPKYTYTKLSSMLLSTWLSLTNEIEPRAFVPNEGNGYS